MPKPKPLVLIILDGWGYSPKTENNAIALARKPTYDKLLTEFPNTLIYTSGRYVGLPDGQMGNSEVGHLNIGAGRVVYMDIVRIDMAIENGKFFENPVLKDSMKNARTGGRQIASLRPGFRRRCALPAGTFIRVVANGQAAGSRARVRPLFHGRPRYASEQWCWIRRSTPAEDARVRRRQDR